MTKLFKAGLLPGRLHNSEPDKISGTERCSPTCRQRRWLPDLALALLATLLLVAVQGCGHLRESARFLGGSEEVNQPRPIILTDESARAGFHFSVGQLALSEGDAREAIREFELAAVYDPDSADIRLTLATLLISAGNLDRAAVHLEKCVALDPQNRKARTLLAGIAYSRKDHDEAARQYRAILETLDEHPENSAITILLAAVEFERKKEDLAITLLKDYLKRHPKSNTVQSYLGRVYAETGRWREAERAFDRVGRITGNAVEPLLQLGKIYEQKERQDDALRIYRKARAKSKDDPRVLSKLGALYIKREEKKRALETFLKLEMIDPDDLDNVVRVGALYFDEKNYPEAMKRFERVRAIRPGAHLVRYYLAVSLIASEDFDRALEEFRQIPAESQFFIDSQTHLGFLYQRLGNVKEAIRVTELAVEGKAPGADMKLALASLYARDQRADDAIRVVREVIEKDPESEQAYYALAIIYDQTKKQDQALAQMQKVMDLNPENAAALNYVGYTWAERGVRLDEAEAFIRRAVSLEPEDGFIRDSLGWVFYQTGRYDEAVKELQEAARLANNDPVILEHLGDAYLKTNDGARALNAYESALEKHPTAEIAPKLREKIQALKSQLKSENP